MPNLIRKLPANQLGKDYVVGDLHGCFDLLERLLNEVRFDVSKDRLFSVGDLVDRGPDSLSCLQLLEKPWFYAVMGNHEEMMLGFFLNYMGTGKLETLDTGAGSDFIVNGGEWVTQYYLPEEACMQLEFDRCLLNVFKMPLMLVVGDGESRFHVVHAELVKPDYKTGEQAVWLDIDIDQWLAAETVPGNMVERLMWSRILMYGGRIGKFNFENRQPGLATTFCGHTPVQTVCSILSHVNIDTGAFYTLDSISEADESYGLTVFNIQEKCWYKSSYLHDGIIRGDFLF